MPAATFARALQGDRRSLARSISLIEARAEGVHEAVAALPIRRAGGPGAPHVIGLTGPPGAGKSTFTRGLVQCARDLGRRVAVVAVDPSSPFSGGAILGDRIRMEPKQADPGVFVRSVASRGHLGGLSRATGQVVDLLDAVGFDLMVIETVGVGQSELSVMEVADTVLVLLTPESGDTVQTMKAGLLEVADGFVVNKADRPGAARLQRALEQMVSLDAELHGREAGWLAPVSTSCATEGEGLQRVYDMAVDHLEWCQGAGLPTWHERRARGRIRTFLDLVSEEARHRAEKELVQEDPSLLDELKSGRINPYLAASRWILR
ncbi:MAG: methylmalonyl Co-A mutase-associated GTPase MeaB [Myxococcota bacterium]|nr:methylmalonyl Co-A mutase-associated GTPase MeaB [Myxococcota bacterium]